MRTQTRLKPLQTMRLSGRHRVCPDCNKSVAEDGRFCTHCGAGMGAQPDSKVRQNVESLLSEANLLRIRHDWTEAELKCVDAIRLEPNNAHAHSLLGDIHFDQGNDEYAGQWYQLALDLDPARTADRAKLGDIENRVARDAVRAASAGSPRSGTQPLAGLSPSDWVKLMWAGFALFVILSTIAIVWARGQQETLHTVTSTASKSGSVGAAAALNPFPRLVAFSPPTATQAPVHESKLAPIDVAAPKTDADLNPQPAAPVSGLDSQGAALKTMLARSGALGEGISVSTVEVDPQLGHASALLVLQSGAQASDADAIRISALKTAARAASALFSFSESLRRVTIDMRSSESAGTLMHGEADRGPIQSLTESSDPSQIGQAFALLSWGSLPPAQTRDSSGGAQPTPAGD